MNFLTLVEIIFTAPQMQDRYTLCHIADVIIILGSGLDGEAVGERTKERLDKGITLFNENDAPMIIMSGGTSAPSGKKSAEIMKEYAVIAGVPHDAILTEEHSKDTLGNAVYCAQEYCLPRQWKNLLVVTSDYHTKRADYIFRKVFGRDYRIQFSSTMSSFSSEILAQAKRKEQKKLFCTNLALFFFRSGSVSIIRRFMTILDPKYVRTRS